jgi:hypothetical protein
MNQPTNQPTNSTTHNTLEKLTGHQLDKKFRAFQGTQNIIIVFTVHHLLLFWAKWLKSTSSHPIYFTCSLTSSYLCLGLPTETLPISSYYIWSL